MTREGNLPTRQSAATQVRGRWGRAGERDQTQEGPSGVPLQEQPPEAQEELGARLS